MNWTRAHDAWIAEHCEGLRVTGPYINGDYHQPIATYNTDVAACIRAAEAWQAAGPDRRILLYIDRDGKRVDAYNGTHWTIVTGEFTAAVLAQALYRATGDPA
jgi:hypothetical protein